MLNIDRVIKYLNSKELFYAFIGDFSMMLYGIKKDAENYELLVNITEGDMNMFIRFLRYERYIPEVMNDEKLVFRTTSRAKLIVKKAKNDMDMRTIGRRTSVNYHYVGVYIASPEDIIISHLKNGEYDSEEVSHLYKRWLNYLDMSYLITFTKAENIYNRFIKFKKKAEKGKF